MKLKYYMRGLGIGIILTTLIFTIVGQTKKELSDDEIIKRATELGMVSEEEATLEHVLNASKPSQAAEEPSVTPLIGVTTTPSTTPAPSPTVALTQAPTPEPTVAPTIEPTIKPEPTKKSEPTEIIKVEFTITRGMSSGQVAKLLVDVGLIDDAADFNQYIVKKGKASIIRVGAYTITQGANYDDIIVAITSKQ